MINESGIDDGKDGTSRKMLRKIIYFLIGILIINNSIAQTKFGVHIGLIASSAREKNIDSISNQYTVKQGFKIGGFAEFKLGNSWAVSSGLSLLNKGVKRDYKELVNGESTTLTRAISTYYLEAEPLTVIHKIKSGFYAGVGPVIGWGIAGNLTTRYKGKLLAKDAAPVNKIKFDKQTNNGNSYDSVFFLKPLELGAAVRIGYEMKRPGLIFLLSFFQSFSNIATDDISVYRNRYLMLGIGYKF